MRLERNQSPKDKKLPNLRLGSWRPKMCANTKLDTPQKANSVANKSLSEQERVFKDRAAQERFDYLVKTRNKLWAIIKFK